MAQRRTQLNSSIVQCCTGFMCIFLVDSEEASEACPLNGDQSVSQVEDQVLRSRLLDLANLHKTYLKLYVCSLIYCVFFL